MPVPIVAGIVGLGASIVAFMGRKVVTAAATIAAFVLLLGVFVACINTILQSILAVLAMPEWIANAVGMFIPFDFGLVLAAIVSSKTCGAAYRMAMTKIKAINFAN